MKYKQSRHSIQAAAALSAVLLSAPAFAQQAGNTNDEIASLKRQLGQLMEKTEQISAKQTPPNKIRWLPRSVPRSRRQ
jgi:hypothetical protein